MAAATVSGESMPTPSSAFIARTRSVASAVLVARGATEWMRVFVSASSRRSASEKPRTAYLLAE
jgi:hypothetical protein